MHSILGRDAGPRWARAVGALACMGLVLLAVVAAGLAWRLSRGPIELAFLRDRIIREVGARLPPGYRVELDAVALEGRPPGLAVLLDGVTLKDGGGAPLVAAPQIEIVFDPRSWLEHGFQPTSIVVDGAAIRLDVPGTRPAPATSDQAGLSLPAITGALDAALSAAGALDTITLRQTSLRVAERTIGRQITYPDLSMTLRRTAGHGGVALSVDLGEGSLDASFKPTEDGGRAVTLQASRLAVADLLAAVSPGEPPPDIVTALSGQGSLVLTPAGSVTSATLGLRAGAGRWTVNPDAQPFTFDQVAFDLHWDAARQVVALDRFDVVAGPAKILAKGEAVPPSLETRGAWTIALDAPGAIIAGATPQIAPLTLDTLAARLRFDPTTRRLGFDRITLDSPDVHVNAVGSVTFEGRSPGVGLAVTAGRMPADAVKSIWPLFVNPEARDFFIRFVSAGTLESATFALAIPDTVLATKHGVPPTLPDESVAADLVLSGVTVKPVPTLPPLTGASGRLTLTGRHLGITIDGASLTAGGQTLDLTKGHYAIRDLAHAPGQQDISFHVAGEARALAELMQMQPLAKAAHGAAPDPKGVTGGVDLDVTLSLPLIDKLTDDQVNYSVLGRLDDVSIGSFAGAKLDDADLKLSILPGAVSIAGSGSMGGAPVTVSYAKQGAATPDLGLTMTLDDAARAKRGFDLGDKLTGPLVLKVRLQSGEDKTSVYAVEADLTATRVNDLLPNWDKPPGRVAKATFSWHPDGTGGDVRNIALDSGSLSVHGDATLGPNATFKRAVLKTVRFSAGDDAQATVDAMPGGWKVSVRGSAFDLRPLLKGMQQRDPGAKAGAGSKDGPDISADVALDEALGFSDEQLSNLGVKLGLKDGVIQRLSLDGTLGAGPISADRTASAGGSPQIRVEATDAGAVLRFLDFYGKVRGGKLEAVVGPSLDSMGGVISMKNFEVRNEAALGQVYTSMPKARAGADEGLSTRFDKLRLVFARTADQIAIQEGVLWGPQVGANLSGSIDYASGRLGLTGVFVPAYAVNNLFSRIPLLGPLLGGEQHEGLFAISFKVSGKLDKPVLTVNPLSAIAPGFLRKLFEFQKN